MRRVEEDGEWSLMCPSQCPGLSECWGEEFEELYERCERVSRVSREVFAFNIRDMGLCDNSVDVFTIRSILRREKKGEWYLFGDGGLFVSELGKTVLLSLARVRTWSVSILQCIIMFLERWGRAAGGYF